METTSAPKTATLRYRDSRSDKLYRLTIEPRGPGFAANFAYGRRGGTLQTGTKTPTPVGYDEAEKIFDRIVREKTAKGYTRREWDAVPAYEQRAA